MYAATDHTHLQTIRISDLAGAEAKIRSLTLSTIPAGLLQKSCLEALEEI